MLAEVATENNTQNHVQLNFNFKRHDIFLSDLVTDVNTSASKRKVLFPCDSVQIFFQA